nr:uncharacterized protein LOC117281177 [Nicotiana tomentosiformis]
MDTLVQHGSVIEELGKEVKKMRKSQASKKSVDKLRRVVTRIATAGDLSFDMLLDPYHSALNPSAPSASMVPAGQSEEPDLAADTAEVVHQMFANPAIPRVEDDEIQLLILRAMTLLGDRDVQGAIGNFHHSSLFYSYFAKHWGQCLLLFGGGGGVYFTHLVL